MFTTPWKIWERVPNADAIAAGIKDIPAHWSLTPLQDKAPKRDGWENEAFIPHPHIADLILDGEEKISKKSGKPYRAYYSGFGLRTGDYSDGLLAIDVDGAQAEGLLQLVSSGDLPLTVSWSSGKPGRRQLLYQIPQQYREQLKNFTRKPIKEWGEFKSDCELDFRYNAVQSVLPPSRHPDTGAYKWINSPVNVSVAIAPEWLCHLVVRLANQEESDTIAKQEAETRRLREREERRAQRKHDGFIGSANLEDLLEESLGRLSIEDIYNWPGHSFVRIGDSLQGCCPQHHSTSKRSFHVNLSSAGWYCHGCKVGGGATQYRHFANGGKGSPTGKDFIEITRELANDAGVEFPELKTTDRRRSVIPKTPVKSFDDLRSGVGRLLNFLNSKKRNFCGWGYSSEQQKEDAAGEQQRTPLKIKYQPGERLTFWETSLDKKFKFIFDSSATGTGKSYESGLVNPTKWGFGRCIYISAEHRNVSTPTLEDWQDLEARHSGLVRDTFNKLRRAKDGETYLIPPNCDRTKLLGVLRDKNVKGADTAELLCPTCPHFEGCREGKEFGFLAQRKATLGATQIRCHPDSLPPVDSFNYAATSEDGGTLLIWEEWSEILKFCREFKVEANDCEQVLMKLTVSDRNQFGLSKFLLELFLALDGCSDLDLGRFGIEDSKVREWLIPYLPEELDIGAIAAVLDDSEQLRSILQGLTEHGVGLEDLDKKTRARFAASDDKLAERAGNLLKEWLVPLLRILKGAPGYLHLGHGTLTITAPDTRFREIAAAAEGNIFLDATGSADKLARILGVEVDDILQCQQAEIKGATVAYHQVAELGRLGMDRRSEQTRRYQAVITQILSRDRDAGIAIETTAVIDAKKYSKEGWLRWFVESRGVNDAESLTQLIAVGVPCRPINRLAAEFAVLNQRSPAMEVEVVRRSVSITNKMPIGKSPYFESRESVDREFREYVRSDNLATLHQGFGRLRANRRAGENLHIWFLGDFPLDVPVELTTAVDQTPEAGDRVQQLQIAIFNFFKAASGKITLTALAEHCEVSKQRLSQLVRELGWSGWAEFKKRLVSLVSPTSKTRQKFEAELEQGFFGLSFEEIQIFMDGLFSEFGPDWVVEFSRILGLHYIWLTVTAEVAGSSPVCPVKNALRLSSLSF